MADKSLIFAMLLLIVSSMFTGYVARPFLESYSIKNPLSKQIMQPLDVEEESFKIWSELKEFYNYNITNLHKKLTEEELKKEGGVCWHYSDWYVEQAEKLGLLAKRVDFYGEDSGHAIAILYDRNLTEYCIVDQRQIPSCVKLGGENEK